MGFLLFFVFVGALVRLVDTQDYPVHIKIASKISVEGLLHPITFLKENCYPVWHILTRTLIKVFRCEGRTAALALTGGCLTGTWACAAFYFLRKHREYRWEIVVAASVLLMLVMPIWLPFFNRRIFIGQGGANPLHNPTHIMVRFMAFPCFIFYAVIMDRIGKKSVSWLSTRRLVSLSFLVLLATLSKPSFVQMFFPAIFILSIFKLIKYKKTAIRPIVTIAMTFIPVVLLVGLQTWVSFYRSGGGGSGIAIAFLKTWKYFSPNYVVSITITILFPLIVFLWSLHARKVTTADVLSWTMYVVSMAQSALLIETGARMWHGNFAWASNLALFFIWFTSIDRFLSLAGEECGGNVADRKCGWWFRCAAVALALHVLSGVCYLWRIVLWGNWG